MAASGARADRQGVAVNPVRKVLRAGFELVERPFDRLFGPTLNPVAQLGALGFFFFWIVAVSGIYLFILAFPSLPFFLLQIFRLLFNSTHYFTTLSLSLCFSCLISPLLSTLISYAHVSP